MKAIKLITTLIGLLFLFNCGKSEPIEISREMYQASVDKVTDIMVHDIFSPPVASRIYVYPNITAYEIMAVHSDSFNSFYGQIKDFPKIQKATDPNVNYDMAALIAHMEVSKRLIFSEQMMEEFRDSLYNIWEKKNPKSLEASIIYGLQVADEIASWIDQDMYKQTRTMPKFTVNTEEVSRWQPTPPAYMDGIEPAWNKIRTLAMESPDQFRPEEHPEFSLEEESQFYQELQEVYEIGNSIRGGGDESEQMEIARFWDCNPYVSVNRGHLMFAKKKITPGAHWIGITEIACRQSDYNFEETLYAYTKTSIALFDGFISCWDEKYRSNLVRPETLINNFIDDQWEPILQTPPFPEYPSGHSVVSGAASTVLTSIFGDNYKFHDDTEEPYGLPARDFTSFNAAADEAAMSRLYGGIHYMAACKNGLVQGRKVGDLVVNKFKMKNF
ncbi:vanadium-dependent haloperoxidase [Aegicerativicinus sediminis]|uniref:vanadium-dependent haloperoxidase n=1 Tax=Aegicerativicinus sediminis TaxID=2893202 RepID=UPI001E526679|nr:vanadium-dependent haloperoxidase [Aegicerativicinus sediminis]